MVHMYYKRKWAGHLAAHVHHMRYWVALYVHKETKDGGREKSREK